MDANAVIQTLLSTAIVTAGIVWLAKTVFQQVLSRDIENHKSHLQTTQAIALQQMKVEQERELEHLRNKMEILSIEHETKFVRLHEKRLQVLIDLYKLLDDLEKYYAQYAVVYRTTESILKEVTKAYSSPNICSLLGSTARFLLKFPFYFSRIIMIFPHIFKTAPIDGFKHYFNENRLYLDETLCDKVLEFHKHLKSRTNLFFDYTHALNYSFGDTMSSNPRVSRHMIPAMIFRHMYMRGYTGKPADQIFEEIEATSRNIKDAKRSIEQEFRFLIGVQNR
jgi:hypothetical protein